MSLISGTGTQRVTREDLALMPLPERTESFQPIAHESLVVELEQSLAFRHISVVKQDYAVSSDGMKMFAFLEVNSEYEGVQFGIGLRNANDKSMRVGIVAGYRVMVCSNMAFHGDFNPMLAKHTKHLNLSESVGVAVDRIQRNWKPLREAIDFKRNLTVDPNDARAFIYRAFIHDKLPVSVFKTVANNFEASDDDSLWAIEQHFTDAFKKLNPIAQYQASAKLGKIFSTINPEYIAGRTIDITSRQNPQ